MRKTETVLITIGTLIIIVGLINISIGNIFFTSIGNVFLILSFILLALFYLALGFAIFNGIKFREIFKKSSYQNISKKRIFGTLVLGFPFSILILGMLFKIMLWPGAQNMIISGLQFILIVTVILTIYYFIKKPFGFKKIFLRIIAITGVSLIIFLIPTKSLIEIYYKNHPEFVELYKNSIDNPNNEQLRKKLTQKRIEINK